MNYCMTKAREQKKKKRKNKLLTINFDTRINFIANHLSIAVYSIILQLALLDVKQFKEVKETDAMDKNNNNNNDEKLLGRRPVDINIVLLFDVH